MELANKQEIIDQAINIKDIDHIKLAQLANFTDEEVDFVELFWESALSDSWISLTKEMVVDWMGYKDSKDTMQDFYKNLKNYEETLEYKEVNKNDEEKHYSITGGCLIQLLMSANTTPKGKFVKKIFKKTKNLVFLMLEIIKQRQLIKIKEQTKKRETLKENAILKELNHKKVDGYIYLKTNKTCAQNNIFKLGSTTCLNRRHLQNKSSQIRDGQEFCVYYRKVENVELCEFLLRRFLACYKKGPCNNIFIMPFSILKPYIDNTIDLYSSQLVQLPNKLLDDMLDYQYNEESTENEKKLIEAQFQ